MVVVEVLVKWVSSNSCGGGGEWRRVTVRCYGGKWSEEMDEIVEIVEWAGVVNSQWCGGGWCSGGGTSVWFGHKWRMEGRMSQVERKREDVEGKARQVGGKGGQVGGKVRQVGGKSEVGRSRREE
ncbi:hypothetical protein Pmani_018458 [Petrolisthes manimaculis]|uniref:Uncharacterized protein n=1 Tax=Petrolisthes manimaculis TaxID=1843537 RepID=A0AAE1PLH6_9EUCA|nr:hypothetical protein Pmani_018458 [Petrolisthes manimaculis]